MKKVTVLETVPAEPPVPNGGKDSLSFCADLDWYFGCAEALSGYRSSMGTQLAVLRAGQTIERPITTESNKWGDGHIQTFTRARRVFATLRLIPSRDQVTLFRHYEARQERRKLAETDVARAHRAFYAAQKGRDDE